MRRIVPLAIVLTCSASLSGCGSSSLLAQSPRAVRSSITAAALAQKSVHWTEDACSCMSGSERIVSDVTAEGGVQRITRWPREKLEIRLVAGTVYVRGNRRGISDELNLTPTQAKRYAGRWISIPKSDKLYAQEASEVTLPSIVHDFTPHAASDSKLVVVPYLGPTGTAGPTGAPRVKHHRGRTDLVELRQVGSGVVITSLTAHAAGEPLPAVWTNQWPGGGVSGRFSKWNEPVHVHAPATSTPVATVRAS